jgi:23S rRNA (pseudouridine1915-N3)-methyltransferase
MKIQLLVIGKTNFAWVDEGFKDYAKRITRYNTFDYIEIADVKNAASLPREVLKQKEGELLLQRVAQGDLLVLLDDKGKQPDSDAFAAMLGKWLSGSHKTLCFAIGGAYGFSPDVYQRADGLLSLSAMTFSHQIVRAIFAEQLYRAFTILKGDPYHHR